MKRVRAWLAARWQRLFSVDDRPRLGLWRAFGRSLFNRPTDFYPRIRKADGAIATLDTEAILKELGETSSGWKNIRTDEGEALKDATAFARQSLNEVKAQTEYQDQKAGRLLTVATIFSALAALLFQRFNDTYPVRPSLGARWWEIGLIGLTYFLFAAFAVSVLCGALVTFHATRTRFKYEEADEAAQDEGMPKSRLFYNPILQVRPSAWAQSFVRNGLRYSSVNPRLAQLYFADLVGETYLIAAKTADKIRYLEEAQRFFARALNFLFLWLAMLAISSIAVGSTAPKADPAKVQIVEEGDAAPQQVNVRIDQQRPLDVSAKVTLPPLPPKATGTPAVPQR